MDAFSSLPRVVQRRTVLVVAATVVLAVVLLACASCAGSTLRDGGAAADATGTGTSWDTWTGRIPEGLRIDHGMPRPAGDVGSDEGALEAVELCAPRTLVAGHPTDVRTVAVSGPEYGEFRSLRVYADDDAARASYDTVVARARDCPSRDTRGGTTWRHQVRERGPTVDVGGDASVVVVQTYEVDDMVVVGASWWRLVRVGNALLVTGTGGEYLPGSALDRGLREHARDVRPVVARVARVFGGD